MENLRCGLITVESTENEFAASILSGLIENNCEVDILKQHSKWHVADYDFLLTYGPMESMTWMIVRLSEYHALPPLIVWFTEQVPTPKPHLINYATAKARFSYEKLVNRNGIAAQLIQKTPLAKVHHRAGRLRALGELLALKSRGMLTLVCTFTESNAHFLRAYGLPAIVVPIGSHPIFSAPIDDVERDVDVVFLGSTRDDRRGPIISQLAAELSARGVNFVIKDGSSTNNYVFGDERKLLLNRSKIMLNVMRQPWDDVVFRMLLAAPAQCMLLTERLRATCMGPFKADQHFAMTELSNFATAIEYYLLHDDERQRIAAQAHQYVTQELTMSHMVKQILVALGDSRVKQPQDSV